MTITWGKSPPPSPPSYQLGVPDHQLKGERGLAANFADLTGVAEETLALLFFFFFGPRAGPTFMYTKTREPIGMLAMSRAVWPSTFVNPPRPVISATVVTGPREVVLLGTRATNARTGLFGVPITE